MTYYNKCIYNDLAQDSELFTSDGDYQFEIYRLMRQETEYVLTIMYNLILKKKFYDYLVYST